MLNFKVPLGFIRERASLTWPEIQFGIRNGWLGVSDAVDVAMDEVSRRSHPTPDLVELAAITPRELGRVAELVERLAGPHDPPSKEKWLYLLLAWVYSNRDQFADAFQVVEEIYATFDYPEQIIPFVRYMPADDSGDVGEQHMLDAWRRYLDRQHLVYGE